MSKDLVEVQYNGNLPPHVRGLEQLVDKVIFYKDGIKGFEVQLEALRCDLEPIVDRTRVKCEVHDKYYAKTWVVKSSRAQDVTLTWADSFKVIPVDDEKVQSLQGVLGVAFDILFKKKTNTVLIEQDRLVAFLKNMEAGAVKGPIKKLATQMLNNFKEVEVYVPVPEVRKIRCMLRDKLTDSQNVVLDAFMREYGNKPSLSIK